MANSGKSSKAVKKSGTLRVVYIRHGWEKTSVSPMFPSGMPPSAPILFWQHLPEKGRRQCARHPGFRRKKPSLKGYRSIRDSYWAKSPTSNAVSDSAPWVITSWMATDSGNTCSIELRVT